MRLTRFADGQRLLTNTAWCLSGRAAFGLKLRIRAVPQAATITTLVRLVCRDGGWTKTTSLSRLLDVEWRRSCAYPRGRHAWGCFVPGNHWRPGKFAA